MVKMKPDEFSQEVVKILPLFTPPPKKKKIAKYFAKGLKLYFINNQLLTSMMINCQS